MKKFVLVAFGAAFVLSACGRMTDLEAPPAKRTERSMRSASAEKLPDPATVYRRPMEAPIEAASNNPYAGSGAYPDPR